jgi:hypothetical protein
VKRCACLPLAELPPISLPNYFGLLFKNLFQQIALFWLGVSPISFFILWIRHDNGWLIFAECIAPLLFSGLGGFEF